VALAERELRTPALVTGTLDAIHEYRGRMLKECVSSMSFVFRSEEFTARYHVPSYAAWLGACDMTPAYEWHRLVLQVLQRRLRTERWVLKSPVHLHSLPTLLTVFPDARLVVTHRDPLAVLGSVTSLVATMRWTHSDEVDYADIGRYHADLYSGSLDRLVDLAECGALSRRPVHHTHYDGFMRDPVGTVMSAAAAIGVPVDERTASAMHDYLDEHPQGAHGTHRYSFDDLHLDPTDARARFARYQEFFDVVSEG
jgi:hypothetical protein